ncbi:hypothetical protein HQ346_02095 [Rhodococcus sp. BP-252]|uniref:Uncharacterized protein n=1 Tax=Rhodococcoides kyotonense TaxID=398843 RepID=A0A177Y6Y8_9NOCA|nr:MULTISPECIES: hypothetical protein [Rhodococcus]MBY6410342.1 hypothetical protein [Rhodococcus sp. BP-320]MBY6416224.1 hypothetical protein [Rhodococcus sp. BP-321]MBY6420219.1 hypothetical protein [Rhodococcus sp. BP-324]MBY6424898.1 hypothetical protein [Rhodococcus sp. BP-323]MBY6430396.1 hypothetical protein [Rhodococcus sp. BP-322]
MTVVALFVVSALCYAALGVAFVSWAERHGSSRLPGLALLFGAASSIFDSYAMDMPTGPWTALPRVSADVCTLATCALLLQWRLVVSGEKGGRVRVLWISYVALATFAAAMSLVADASGKPIVVLGAPSGSVVEAAYWTAIGLAFAFGFGAGAMLLGPRLLSSGSRMLWWSAVLVSAGSCAAVAYGIWRPLSHWSSVIGVGRSPQGTTDVVALALLIVFATSGLAGLVVLGVGGWLYRRRRYRDTVDMLGRLHAFLVGLYPEIDGPLPNRGSAHRCTKLLVEIEDGLAILGRREPGVAAALDLYFVDSDGDESAELTYVAREAARRFNRRFTGVSAS